MENLTECNSLTNTMKAISKQTLRELSEFLNQKAFKIFKLNWKCPANNISTKMLFISASQIILLIRWFVANFFFEIESEIIRNRVTRQSSYFWTQNSYFIRSIIAIALTSLHRISSKMFFRDEHETWKANFLCVLLTTLIRSGWKMILTINCHCFLKFYRNELHTWIESFDRKKSSLKRSEDSRTANMICNCFQTIYWPFVVSFSFILGEIILDFQETHLHATKRKREENEILQSWSLFK